jgi:hypothetical protein
MSWAPRLWLRCSPPSTCSAADPCVLMVCLVCAIDYARPSRGSALRRRYRSYAQSFSPAPPTYVPVVHADGMCCTRASLPFFCHMRTPRWYKMYPPSFGPVPPMVLPFVHPECRCNRRHHLGLGLQAWRTFQLCSSTAVSLQHMWQVIHQPKPMGQRHFPDCPPALPLCGVDTRCSLEGVQSSLSYHMHVITYVLDKHC